MFNYRHEILLTQQWPTVSGADLGDVRVGCIRVYALVFNDVSEGVCHEATIAPTVSVFLRTVHQVLRTEGNQDTCRLLQLPLQSSNSTEGPTRATRTLEGGRAAHQLKVEWNHSHKDNSF